MSAWWNRPKNGISAAKKSRVPSGVFQKCDGCRKMIPSERIRQYAFTCPECGQHFVMSTQARIELVMDANSFAEQNRELVAQDRLSFVDTKAYPDRLREAAEKAAFQEAFVWGHGTIEGLAVAAGFFVYEFMGGSMGAVVGEKITRLFEAALARREPAIIFCASGGARMQEGIFSLMQMAKTVAARGRLRQAGIPYIAVLLHPTTGGVAASFAMLGDITLAEPQALIGFAGPRVIEQTIGQKLPAGFQRSEYLLEHGFVDQIVPRSQMRSKLATLLGHLTSHARDLPRTA